MSELLLFLPFLLPFLLLLPWPPLLLPRGSSEVLGLLGAAELVDEAGLLGAVGPLDATGIPERLFVAGAWPAGTELTRFGW